MKKVLYDFYHLVPFLLFKISKMIFIRIIQ